MRALRDFLFGLLFLDLYRETAKLNKELNLLIGVLLFGDFLGVPLLTSYYSLRLLPYAYPMFSEIRKEAVKEHEIFDLMSEYHAH